MSLDEAIQHLNEVLSSDKVWSCEEYKRDHIQLREWLKELREYRRTNGKQSDAQSNRTAAGEG